MQECAQWNKRYELFQPNFKSNLFSQKIPKLQITTQKFFDCEIVKVCQQNKQNEFSIQVANLKQKELFLVQIFFKNFIYN